MTIDDRDIRSGYIVDIKTETTPSRYYNHVIQRIIDDDTPYGRRLVSESQVSLLSKYDFVIFGAFEGEHYDKWYDVGYIEVEHILKSYSVTKNSPHGGTYPVAGLSIRNSDLHPLKNLKDEITVQIEKGRLFF